MSWVLDNHRSQDPDAVSQEEIDQRFLMYEAKLVELIVGECVQISQTSTDGFTAGRRMLEQFGIEP